MTTEEFSNQFDVQINSYSKILPITFNEYEKSLFLTNALNLIIKAAYSDSSVTGFESTLEYRRYLSRLIKVGSGKFQKRSDGTYYVISPSSEHLWFVVEEDATIKKNGCIINADVVPVRHDELSRIKRNPFRGNYNNRVLRVDRNEGTSADLNVEYFALYVPKNTILESYTYRYLQLPEPIILEDLPDGLTIDGKSKQQTCKLNDVLHPIILESAVSLAVKSKSGSSK